MKAFYVSDQRANQMTSSYPMVSIKKKLVIANNMADVIAAFPNAFLVEEIDADVRILKSIVVKDNEP